MAELEQLVEAGNWQAVMAAAAKYDDASDAESSRRSMLDNSEHDQQHSPFSSPESDKGNEEIRAQIEELVREVVPDELGELISIVMCSKYNLIKC